MDKMKLQNILLKLANDVLDLEKSGKTLGEPIDEATQAILDLLDKSDLESAIKRCGYGFRSLSLHSDGRWIAKSGAGTGKFLTTGKIPLEAVLKLEAKLDVRKVIKED